MRLIIIAVLVMSAFFIQSAVAAEVSFQEIYKYEAGEADRS